MSTASDVCLDTIKIRYLGRVGITYRTRGSMANRSRRTCTTPVDGTAAAAAAPTMAEGCRPEAAGPTVACTRRRLEIWTGPCRWPPWAAACPDCRPQPAAVGARARTDGARTSSATGWSSDVGMPFRGNTWARRADSGPASSGTRVVSYVFSVSPAAQQCWLQQWQFLFTSCLEERTIYIRNYLYRRLGDFTYKLKKSYELYYPFE